MKRFTETEKWKDSWFRELSRDSKLAFIYIIENCDGAGVWEADYALANFCIGGDPLDWDAVLTDMGDRVTVLPSGKWFLTKFVAFQYGELKPDCKPHAAVLKLLSKHGISIEYAKGIQTVTLPKGSLTLKDKEKDTDKDKETDKGHPPASASSSEFGGGLALEQAMPPELDNPEFRAAWDCWLKYRRERKLPKLIPRSIDMQLRKLAGWGCPAAIESINASIQNQWQGLFAPRADGSGGKPGRRASFA